MSRVKLNITGLTYSHSQSDAYALILEEEGDDNRKLPVVIGKNEAQAIAIYLENLESPRPLTHDLIKTITDTLQASIIEVNIIRMVAGIFYAEISLIKDAHIFKIDSRVSDAVALALRFDCPIYCTEKVMETASFIIEEHEKESEIEDPEVIDDIYEEPLALSEYTTQKLELLMNEAVRNENYEKAARLKKELDSRKETNE